MFKKVAASFIFAVSLCASINCSAAKISSDQIDSLCMSEKGFLRIELSNALYDKLNNSDDDEMLSYVLSTDLHDMSFSDLLDSRNTLQAFEDDHMIPEYSAVTSLYSADLGANYVTWAKLFGIEDLDSSSSISDSDVSKNKTMFIDSLAIVYDPQTFKTDHALLFLDIDDENSEVFARFSAFMTALEYGKIIDYSVDEGMLALETSQRIFDKIYNCMADKEEELIRGEMIPVYVSEKNHYYLSFDGTYGCIVSVWDL